MRNQKDRPEAKKAFKDVKTVWDELVKKYDLSLIKWAFSRKLNWEAEKSKLAREKANLETRLQEINKELE